MKKYNFYNKEYGIKLQLTLNEEKKELIYQCAGIRDEYRGEFRYACDNGWIIISDTVPAISYRTKQLFLYGRDYFYDGVLASIKQQKSNGKNIIIVCHNGKEIDWTASRIHKSFEEVYHKLIDALEEIGNDADQARLFLDM